MAMASSGHLEEQRPPEDPVKRAISNIQAGDFNAALGNNNEQSGLSNDNNGNLPSHNGNIEEKSCPAVAGATLDDVNPKKMRDLSNISNLSNLSNRRTQRPMSLPPGELNANNVENKNRKRRSCQQDVEEALSSLLWQPYEYRTQSSDSSDTLSTLSLSTGSSSSTSLSHGYDYATVYKSKQQAGLLHSFTDEFLNLSMATSPLASMQVYPATNGNHADPNLQAQMVSNLMVLDASAVGLAAHQYQRAQQSRGCETRSAAAALSHSASSSGSGLGLARSRVRDLVQKCARLSLGSPAPANGILGYSGAVRDYSSVYCDNVQVISGDMRVEIPGSGPADIRPDINSKPHRTQNNVLYQCSSNIAVDGGASGSECVSVQNVSNDMIPSNITSVVSANVVGLPVHSRSSSNLSATGRADIVPTHPRTHSDTSTNVLHFRTGSNLSNSNTRHPSLPPISVTTNNPQQAHSRATSEVSTNTPGIPGNPGNLGNPANPSNQGNLGNPKQPNEINIFHNRQDSNNGQRVPPLPNVSNVNVNFYRAVPVNVVSNVPTIQCLNSVEETQGNNVSNVHIVQAMPQTSTIQQQQQQQQILVHQSTPQVPPAQEVRTRTFTSTEAQTDDTTVGATVSQTAISNREQRRRERREKRHQRRLNNHPHPHTTTSQQTQQIPNQPHQTQWVNTNPNGPQSPNDRLPDLLNSHLPPPYSTLPSGMPPPLAVVAGPPPPGTMVPFHHPGVVPVVQGAPPPVPVPVPVSTPTGFRFPFPTAAGFRRCRSRLGPRYSTEEHQPKSCCGFLVSRPGSLRWFIALIALVAVCCVLVGTVLGAMRPAGRDHLTVSLLMIGVGIVLVTVSGVAWRLTSHDAPSCRAMLGLESSDAADVCTRRFVPRLPPSYGRPHHPYAAMIYPEFQYRPPPPSYQASMQEYRLRLLLLDRGNSNQGAQGAQHAVSPPPTYRSHAGSLLRAPLSNRRDANQSEYSCPPSYRSRSSNRQQANEAVVHSREQSLSLSESNHDGSVVNVVNILANQEEEIALENMTLDSLKVAPENEIPPLRMLLKSSSGSDLETSKDGNLVTIVQKADQNPVIVTVSGSQMSTANPEVGSSNQIPSEMEILAHL